LSILQGEYERLNNSLYPFMKINEYNNPHYTSDKSKLSLDQIFANRLKNLDISVPTDFEILYENEKQHLSQAVRFIKNISNTEYLKTYTMQVILDISRHAPGYNVTIGDVGNHLRSLSDLREDNMITYTNNFYKGGTNAQWSLSYYFSPDTFKLDAHLIFVTPIRELIYAALQEFFPNLDAMIPIGKNPQYENMKIPNSDYVLILDVFRVLKTLEQISISTGGFTLHTETKTTYDILEILRNRQYVARLISTLGPQLEPLNEMREGVTRSTRWTRFLISLRTQAGHANENLEAMTHLNTTVWSMFGRLDGGKTRRRRPTRSSNKTQYKRDFDEGVRDNPMTSSASHKSTRETINRKKTKRSNRPKKNKTRRKRNY